MLRCPKCGADWEYITGTYTMTGECELLAECGVVEFYQAARGDEPDREITAVSCGRCGHVETGDDIHKFATEEDDE